MYETLNKRRAICAACNDRDVRLSSQEIHRGASQVLLRCAVASACVSTSVKIYMAWNGRLKKENEHSLPGRPQQSDLLQKWDAQPGCQDASEVRSIATSFCNLRFGCRSLLSFRMQESKLKRWGAQQRDKLTSCTAWRHWRKSLKGPQKHRSQ